MQVIPTSPVRRVVFGGAVVLLLVVAVVQRQRITDVYEYFFPGRATTAAAGRTSDPAPTVPDPTTTTSRGATTTAPEGPRPTGTDPAIELRRLAEIEMPAAVVDLPGPGPVLVATLPGQVLEVDLATGASEVVLDVSDRIAYGGEQGLLGMALAPDGERLYLDYTNTAGDTEVRSIAMAGGRPAGVADDMVLHLEIGQPFRNHNGGNLVFGPDGALWIGTGDGGSADDPDDLAQDPSTLLGKMLRVVPDPTGGVLAPAGNPDWGGGRPEIWAIGLRNPWRYSFDRLTGQLWVADVGQNQFEEVSVVDPTDSEPVNFGWDLLEGDQPFEGQPRPDLTDPVVVYSHSEGCSITGGHVYRGAAASLYGWYVFGDFCGGWIRAVPADDPTSEPVELLADAGPALSFAELEDGELLFLTFDGIHAIVAG